MEEQRLAKLEAGMTALLKENKSQTRIITEICRTQRKMTDVYAAHEKEDERRFTKIETNLEWHRRIGVWVLGVGNALLHFVMHPSGK